MIAANWNNKGIQHWKFNSQGSLKDSDRCSSVGLLYNERSQVTDLQLIAESANAMQKYSFAAQEAGSYDLKWLPVKLLWVFSSPGLKYTQQVHL